MTDSLIDAIATPEPPALDFSPRAGTLPVVELTQRVEAWCAARHIASERRPLLLALALLYHDHEPDAHQLVQKYEGQPDADAIHAILHRREGDAGNAGYWWKAVGAHPVFPALAVAAARHGVPGGREEGFDPLAVIAAITDNQHNVLVATRLRAYQGDEFRILADHLK